MNCSSLQCTAIAVGAPVRRQVKDDNGEEGDGDARYDEVDGVEERLAADGDVERDVRLWSIAVVKPLHVLARRNVKYVPLHAPVEVLQVDTVFNDIRLTRPALLLVNMGQVDLQTRKWYRNSDVYTNSRGPLLCTPYMPK